MHGTAQAKIVKFLEKLSLDNQLLYTTHSPFMIDVDHLERARAVYEGQDGSTKITEDTWPKDADTLFPLQAALGYNIAQGLFISKRQLIVEGITDLWIVKALKIALAKLGRETIRDDVVVIPADGTGKLLPLACMLVGHDVEVAALLDGDEPGRREGKKLTEKLLQREAQRCIFVGDFTDNQKAETEDILTEGYYLEALKETFPSVQVDFIEEENKIDGIVNKVEAMFQRKGLGKFEKWLVSQAVRDKMLESPDKIPKQTVDIAEKIFQSINKAFTK